MKYRDFFEEELNEVHFSEMYPKGFMDFYNEWKKHKHNKSLYVRFDGGDSTDVLSKAPSQTPNHSDMIGVYAYPLKYVIDHPADIWYGHNSKTLKVIKDKSRNKIVLNYMVEWEAKNLLRKVGLDSAYSHAEIHYPERNKGKNAVGKMFMSAVQMDFSKSETPPRAKFGIRRDYKKPTVRTGKEQTQLLLKMGIDAVEDVSKNLKDAIINDREPEQICFLKPTSYQILETFVLSDRKTGGSVIFHADKLKRKYAAAIASIMDDSIIDSDGFDKFWTKKERLIDISVKDLSLDFRMKNLKIGEKPHKFSKKDSPHSLTAKVYTERGNFDASLWSDSKMEEALDSVKQKFYNLASVDNGSRYSKKSHEDKEKEEKQKWMTERKKKEDQETLELWELVRERYNGIADRMGLEKIPEGLTDKQILDTHSMMRAKSSQAILPYYKDAVVSVVNGYANMIEKLEQKGRTASRIPLHVLSDLMEYQDLNEIYYKDFYSHLFENKSRASLYKKSEEIFNRLQQMRKEDPDSYNKDEYSKLRKEFSKISDEIEDLDYNEEPESDVEIETGPDLISYETLDKFAEKNSNNYIASRLVRYKGKKWASDYINLRNEVIKKIKEFTKTVPYVNFKSIRSDLLSDDDYKKNSVSDFFPLPIEVSSSPSDDMTISVTLESDGRFSGIFEGNDEASSETVRLVNKLINPNGRMVKIYGTHGRDLTEKIKSAGEIPEGIYVSPSREYSSGYMDLKGERETFSGYININDVNQESEYDWKTVSLTPIKNFRYL